MRKLTDSRPKDSAAVLASGRAVAHESARKHVAGAARYIDDLPVPIDLVYVATGQSSEAHARIKHLDLTRVKAAPGVLDVVVQADIPGKIDVAPVYGGDPLLAGDEVEYVGQPIFAVAATSQEAALRAVALAEVEYEPLTAQLTVEQSIAADSYVLPEHHLMMGDPDGELMRSPHRVEGEVYVRGQEHFYLEGQIGQAYLTEDGGIHVISSTQHPSEIQKLVAEVLALPFHRVVAEVRRMGGGFGGKESQAGPLACLCALLPIGCAGPFATGCRAGTIWSRPASDMTF